MGVVRRGVLVRTVQVLEVTTLEVFVRQMPSRVLSSNGSRGVTKRAQMAVVDGKVELGVETDKAILAAFYPNFPRLTPPVIITLTLYARHNTKNGDGRYRAEDVFNIGGEIAKPIVDAFVKRGIITDDDYLNVPFGVLHIEHVDRLEDEGIGVQLRELEVS